MHKPLNGLSSSKRKNKFNEVRVQLVTKVLQKAVMDKSEICLFKSRPRHLSVELEIRDVANSITPVSVMKLFSRFRPRSVELKESGAAKPVAPGSVIKFP